MKHHHNIQKTIFFFNNSNIMAYQCKISYNNSNASIETNILQLKNIKWNVLQELQVLNLTLQLFID